MSQVEMSEALIDQTQNKVPTSKLNQQKAQATQQKGLLGEQNGKKQQGLKLWQLCGKFLDASFKTEKLISHQMYKSLKYIFLFLLYLSYGFLIAALVLIWINAQAQKQQFIDYVNNQGRIELLVVLIFLGILIATAYKCYSQNKELTPSQRKFTNFLLDCLKLAFHLCFLFYVLDFVQMSQQQIIKVAFILFIVSICAFGIRFIIKWSHFYIGQGRGDHACSQTWGSIFQPTKEEKQNHMQKIQQLKETLQLFIQKNKKNEEYLQAS